jgi:hypothetical protein
MTVRLDFKFTPELTPKQEQVFIDETYKIYWELKVNCEKLMNTKRSWNFRLAQKVGGKTIKNLEKVCDVAREMYDNLERCKTGEITSDQALFLFERVNENKEKYYVQINEQPFARIKVNVIRKDNWASRLVKEYKKNFHNYVIPKMKYTGTCELMEYYGDELNV